MGQPLLCPPSATRHSEALHHLGLLPYLSPLILAQKGQEQFNAVPLGAWFCLLVRRAALVLCDTWLGAHRLVTAYGYIA